MSAIRLTAFVLFALPAPAAVAQEQPAAGGAILPVTRCDPATNSCSPAPPAVVEDPVEPRVSVPGCRPLAPGQLLCGMLQDYHHCRTLLISSMVESCRIEVAFSSGAIEARAALPGSYELTVESGARALIRRNERGFGQARGSASVELRFDLPAEAAMPAVCLQRDQYLYFATGPEGGLPEIKDSEPCDTPLTFNFRAHADDFTRAWDLCETFAAWGEDLEDSIEILAASVFHIRSAASGFIERYPGGAATIAPYVLVKAPLTIECRD